MPAELTQTVGPTAPARLIECNGCSHCVDLRPVADNDPPALRVVRDEIRTRDVLLAAQELVGSAKAGGGRSSGGSGGGGSRSSFSGGRSSSDGRLGRPGPGMLERTLSRPFGRSRADGKEVSL